MKNERQKVILDIISSQNVETQEELGVQLQKRGYRVTQATISRDIKELHLIKVQAERGVYKYAVNESSTVLNTERMMRIFREVVVSIKGSGNIVVVNTLSGSGPAAGEAIDNFGIQEIIGSLAGDNTVFLVVEEHMRSGVIQKLKALMR
ncbi:MAG: arginine repressor [Clostridiales bacterium]|nr:MAG: arginine repressor [Clostridiales bacterium]